MISNEPHMAHDNELDLLEHYTVQCAVPILLQLDNLGTGLLGTGTFFTVADRHFLVTANHNFEDLMEVHKEQLAVPASHNTEVLHTLGPVVFYAPVDDRLDVAVIELRDAGLVKQLQRHWRFLTLAHVAAPAQEARDGSIVLAGYPKPPSANKNGWTPEGQVRGRFLFARTQRIPTTPNNADAIVDGRHFFCDYEAAGTLRDGTVVPSPPLPGVSGASVWERQPAVEGVWSAEAALRVIGVENSLIAGHHFRVTHWSVVADVLRAISPEIAQAVDAELHL